MQKTVILLIIIILSLTTMNAQNFSAHSLYSSYENYKEKSVKDKRISHDEIMPYVLSYKENQKFKIKELGKSLQNRPIYLISFGRGPVNILAWSQMHGDESTASMALLDILKFFAAEDEFDELRKEILDKVTIHLIPMLNPDGAERYSRRNALDIDLNRDAARLQFPESKILKSARDSLNADFGFNLHDQSTRYTSGKSFKAATIAFLAPAYNHEKEINQVRLNTMKVIVNIHEELSKFIPGHIAKYDDEFEPRAFGDNFMKWGTSSILIESGGWKNNHEKQFIRKLNFIALLAGFNSIAAGKYKNADVETYNAMPENERRLFDLMLRNLYIEFEGGKYVIDIGINHNERGIKNNRDDYFVGTIEDIGDLSTFYGYDEIDCSSMVVKPGSTMPDTLKNLKQLEMLKFTELYKQGYTSVRVKDIDTNYIYSESPIIVLSTERKFNNKIRVGNIADLTIWQNEKVRFVVINGFLYDLISNKNYILNGLILK